MLEGVLLQQQSVAAGAAAELLRIAANAANTHVCYRRKHAHTHVL